MSLYGSFVEGDREYRVTGETYYILGATCESSSTMVFYPGVVTVDSGNKTLQNLAFFGDTGDMVLFHTYKTPIAQTVSRKSKTYVVKKAFGPVSGSSPLDLFSTTIYRLEAR